MRLLLGVVFLSALSLAACDSHGGDVTPNNPLNPTAPPQRPAHDGPLRNADACPARNADRDADGSADDHPDDRPDARRLRSSAARSEYGNDSANRRHASRHRSLL